MIPRAVKVDEIRFSRERDNGVVNETRFSGERDDEVDASRGHKRVRSPTVEERLSRQKRSRSNVPNGTDVERYLDLEVEVDEDEDEEGYDEGQNFQDFFDDEERELNGSPDYAGSSDEEDAQEYAERMQAIAAELIAKFTKRGGVEVEAEEFVEEAPSDTLVMWAARFKLGAQDRFQERLNHLSDVGSIHLQWFGHDFVTLGRVFLIVRLMDGPMIHAIVTETLGYIRETLTRIPDNAVLKVVNYINSVSSEDRIRFGSWVRVRRGVYRGDYGYVTKHFNGSALNGEGRFAMLVVPQLHMKTDPEPRRGRPIPRLRTPEFLTAAYGDEVEPYKEYLGWGRHSFRAGLLLLAFHGFLLQVVAAPPMETVLSFIPALGMAKVLPLLYMDTALHLEPGNRVWMVKGDYSSRAGTIQSILCGLATVRLDSDIVLVDEVEVSVEDIQAFFKIGDYVRVRVGEHAGTEGFLQLVEDDEVEIIVGRVSLDEAGETNLEKSAMDLVRVCKWNILFATPPHRQFHIPHLSNSLVISQDPRDPRIGLLVSVRGGPLKGRQGEVVSVNARTVTVHLDMSQHTDDVESQHLLVISHEKNPTIRPMSFDSAISVSKWALAFYMAGHEPKSPRARAVTPPPSHLDQDAQVVTHEDPGSQNNLMGVWGSQVDAMSVSSAVEEDKGQLFYFATPVTTGLLSVSLVVDQGAWVVTGEDPGSQYRLMKPWSPDDVDVAWARMAVEQDIDSSGVAWLINKHRLFAPVLEDSCICLKLRDSHPQTPKNAYTGFFHSLQGHSQGEIMVRVSKRAQIISLPLNALSPEPVFIGCEAMVTSSEPVGADGASDNLLKFGDVVKVSSKVGDRFCISRLAEMWVKAGKRTKWKLQGEALVLLKDKSKAK
ncbi:hypothetical protein JAAARDRAFT_200842 [Jaapia argillacea MUCL 33604]|uniref:KOW domain-containing protein n=1 Tax=Jaapia argillacea MUCL 33604 TaxID=933084 RepID=A0A067P3I1_9AGAM|nr:hypothetical protein JAAARDRAFT_200842 [Jaapia argillacea MUCL 33604]